MLSAEGRSFDFNFLPFSQGNGEILPAPVPGTPFTHIPKPLKWRNSMTSTALALRTDHPIRTLGTAVNDAVGRYLAESDDDRLALAKAAGQLAPQPRKIAGLTVISDDEPVAEYRSKLKERRHVLKRYLADKEKVVEQLKAVDIEPLAVLPKSAWERLCEEAKFYRFRPAKDGTVFADGLLLKILRNSVEENCASIVKRRNLANLSRFQRVRPWSLLVFGLACFSLWAYFEVYRPDKAAQWNSVLMLFGTLSVIIGAWCGFSNQNKRLSVEDAFKEKPPEWYVQQIVQQHKRKLKQMLWPNRREPDLTNSERDERIRLKLELPLPPQETQAILLRAEGLRLSLHVAAVGRAIAVSTKNLVASLLKEKERQDTEARRLAMQHDPIVYVEQGFAVAIIAQYGEFKAEQELIDKIVGSVQLI